MDRCRRDRNLSKRNLIPFLDVFLLSFKEWTWNNRLLCIRSCIYENRIRMRDSRAFAQTSSARRGRCLIAALSDAENCCIPSVVPPITERHGFIFQRCASR